jgi:hypothetical protein
MVDSRHGQIVIGSRTRLDVQLHLLRNTLHVVFVKELSFHSGSDLPLIYFILPLLAVVVVEITRDIDTPYFASASDSR